MCAHCSIIRIECMSTLEQWEALDQSYGAKLKPFSFSLTELPLVINSYCLSVVTTTILFQVIKDMV